MKSSEDLLKNILILAFITAALLLIPLVAMQYDSGVEWTLSDFIVAGTMLFGTGLAYLFLTSKSPEKIYKMATLAALGSTLFLLWANLAVGIIGSENEPVNMIYFTVPSVGIIGGLLSGFRSKGLSYTMFAMAITQALITAIALVMGMQHSPGISIVEILGVNGLFIVLFMFSGFLYKKAATQDTVMDS